MKKTLLILIALAMTACHSYQPELKASLAALNAGRDGFVAWDDGHQQALVADAKTLEEGQASLKEYRAKREVAIRGFEIAYQALAVAALTPTAENVSVVITDLANLKTTVEALGAAWTTLKTGGT